MRQSMTGFASRSGAGFGQSWIWEIRGVNDKGLDVRLRLPEAATKLEQPLSKAVSAVLQRGHVQVSLRLSTQESEDMPRLDPARLESILNDLQMIEAQAAARGLSLSPSSSAQIFSMRGLHAPRAPEAQAGQAPQDAPLMAALLDDFKPVLADFCAARMQEGSALSAIRDSEN